MKESEGGEREGGREGSEREREGEKGRERELLHETLSSSREIMLIKCPLRSMKAHLSLFVLGLHVYGPSNTPSL